jgi:hypothetical protein
VLPPALLFLSSPLRALSRCGSTPLRNGSTPSRLLAFHWGSWWRSLLRAFLSSFWLPKRRRPSVPSPTPSRMRSLKPMLTKRHSGGRESGRSCAAWVGSREETTTNWGGRGAPPNRCIPLALRISLTAFASSAKIGVRKFVYPARTDVSKSSDGVPSAVNHARLHGMSGSVLQRQIACRDASCRAAPDSA